MKILQRSLEIFKALTPEVRDWGMRTHNASLAFQGRKIIAYGQNTPKTTPINLRNRKTNSSGFDYSNTGFSCSEWNCLRAVKNKTNIPFSKITLINYRVNRNGEIGISTPCKSCQSLLTFLDIGRVWNTNHEGKFELYK